MSDLTELDGKQKWLLGKMGVHESAWAYGFTLIRVCSFNEEEGQAILDAFVTNGLFEVETAPCGPRYRLTAEGREARLALGTKVGKAHS